MIKKEVFIGLIAGLVANALGLFLAIQWLGNDDSIQESIRHSMVNGFFGKLVSIGAVLNLVLFFIFLKKKQDYRARGVLLATLLVAAITLLIKFI